MSLYPSLILYLICIHNCDTGCRCLATIDYPMHTQYSLDSTRASYAHRQRVMQIRLVCVFESLSLWLRQQVCLRIADDLMRAVYAPGIHVSDRTLDSHVRHVRAKLAAAGADGLIETVHGVGFRLNPA